VDQMILHGITELHPYPEFAVLF